MIDFSRFETETSKFSAEFKGSGGYITFSNSGQRGETKYFTLGISSFICCLEDITRNIGSFRGHENYHETEWRDLSANYYTDKPAIAQAQVQTKPFFSTLSKIILWANSDVAIQDPENQICLEEGKLAEAIAALQRIESKFIAPANTRSTSVILKSDSIREFAKLVFEHFYKKKWASLIEGATSSEKNLEGNVFNVLKIGPFTSLLAQFESLQDREGLVSVNTLRYFIDPVFQDDEYFYYFSTQWNATGDYPLHFSNLKTYFEDNFPNYTLKHEDGEFSLNLNSNQLDKSVSRVILPKPFLLLAGISGTGKTRFVRKQALEDLSNYKLVPVRPDWHEPTDLLGYVSRLGDNGANFIVTDTLKFIVKAWLAAIDPGFAVNGQLRQLEEIETYWLCLDEMNLAPVEQYFADYLSILETRNWTGGKYSCDPLVEFDALVSQISSDGMSKLRKDLGLEGSGLWDYFVEKGMPIPPNLVVAGTVNMDETTHGFSRKVIDRAFTVDFGEFFPNDYSEYFLPATQPIKLSFPRASHVTEKSDLSLVTADPEGLLSLQFLKEINSVLRDTPFQLAYRALNELFLALVSFKPESLQELKAVWDDFLMSKVLPRIDGDAEKLSAKEVSVPGDNLLEQLTHVLETQFDEVWSGDRPDLLRENLDGTELLVNCRSARKLKLMQALLINNGFTSFWP